MANKKCLLTFTGAFKTQGGIAKVNQFIIKTLQNEGSIIKLFVLLEEDIKKINPEERKFFIYKGFGGNKLAFTLAIWFECIFYKYDLILSDHVNLAAALFPLSVLLNIKYLVWAHGEEVLSPKPTFEGRLGLKNASKVLTSSAFTAQAVREIYPHLSVFPCDLALDPVKYPRLTPLDELLGLSAERLSMVSLTGTRETLGERAILNVARMSSFQRYKGQDTLLNAFPTVQSKYPDAQLVLCGDGDDYARFLDLASSFPQEVQRNIFMPGYVGDDLLNRLFRKCYLFAMPSSGEGFGLVYLEAMSFAKPCLGGKLDATPYVVRDGLTGVLVDDPASPQQVADKLILLFSDPPAARAMGVAGYALVRTNYLFEHFSQRFWDALAA